MIDRVSFFSLFTATDAIMTATLAGMTGGDG